MENIGEAMSEISYNPNKGVISGHKTLIRFCALLGQHIDIRLQYKVYYKAVL